MPLPPPNTMWPPQELEQVHTDVARWSAWWSGDPDQLSQVYGGEITTTERSFSERGGLMGAVQRFFWGQKPTPGEQRTKLHLPLAAEIASVSADLLFAQPPTITCTHKATQDRIDQLMGDHGGALLHQGAESCAALGHVYLRGGWDMDVDSRDPLGSVVDADAAFPTHRYGRLVEVTFCREWVDGGTVLRHLELHEPGIIWHAAYLGDHRTLGRQVPLEAHPQTAGLVVDGMVADDRRDGLGIETGFDRLDVVGIPNARSRAWRHLPAARDLGRADIAGLEGVLDALDDVYSSWMRDIRHGRSRLHVPAHMLESQGLGKGAQANLDQELYVGLEAPPDGPLQLEATQFKIRYEEHRASADQLAERIVSGAGYSPQTFGFDADSALTASENWSRQIRSQHTRNGKARYWKPAVADYVWTLLAIDNHIFGGRNDLDAEIVVEFADTVSESTLARATTAQALRTAEAASTRTLVEMVHNDRDADWVDQEVLRIELGDEKVREAQAALEPDDQDGPGTMTADDDGEGADDSPDTDDTQAGAARKRQRRRRAA